MQPGDRSARVTSFCSAADPAALKGRSEEEHCVRVTESSVVRTWIACLLRQKKSFLYPQRDLVSFSEVFHLTLKLFLAKERLEKISAECMLIVPVTGDNTSADFEGGKKADRLFSALRLIEPMIITETHLQQALIDPRTAWIGCRTSKMCGRSTAVSTQSAPRWHVSVALHVLFNTTGMRPWCRSIADCISRSPYLRRRLATVAVRSAPRTCLCSEVPEIVTSLCTSLQNPVTPPIDRRSYLSARRTHAPRRSATVAVHSRHHGHACLCSVAERVDLVTYALRWEKKDAGSYRPDKEA